MGRVIQKTARCLLVEETEAARAMNDDVNIKRLAHKLKAAAPAQG